MISGESCIVSVTITWNVTNQQTSNFILYLLPLGTIMSAYCFVGSMYESKAGFTKVSYCFKTPLRSLPLSLMSRDSLRHNLMSLSVSTNIFTSSRSRTSLFTNAMIPVNKYKLIINQYWWATDRKHAVGLSLRYINVIELTNWFAI